MLLVRYRNIHISTNGMISSLNRLSFSSSSSSSSSSASSSYSSAHARLSRRMVDWMKRHPIKSVALTGLVVSGIYHYRKKLKEELEEEENDGKKKVLVLPFYQMNLVEESKKDWKSAFNKMSSSPGSSSRENIEMSVDELVHLIHQAAQDPNIVALYGILGHGHGFSTGGWAHIEEVRNALLVFGQSHRLHREPTSTRPSTGNNSNSNSGNNDVPASFVFPRPPRKPMYVYTNTFSSPMGSATDMKDYYLASAFTHIHLQPQGDLNLFGLHTTNTFWKDFLAKYGIQVHVWKHGLYKNFANQFTHAKYTAEHKENVKNILYNINQHVCHGIYTSRYSSLKTFEFSNFWKMVHQAGSFPADMAQRIGFVDYLPILNPLNDMLEMNQRKQKQQDKNDENNNPKVKVLEKKLGQNTNMHQFQATSKISIVDYAKQKKREKAKQDKKWEHYMKVKNAAEKNVVAKQFLSLLGYSAPYFNIPESEFSEEKAKGLREKIAVLKIGGTITDQNARKLERALLKLKQSKDVKAVVLRVDSPGGAVTACETIYQQLYDLPQKVVVSFGNVSASGGYYISSNAERIFASPTTITGSIGVFMMRVDLRGLAKQYGITFDSVPTSEMSGSFDPFYPINDRMKDNFSSFADRVYLHFKRLVSNGRKMDLDKVESVAQGRVWTGQQAKQIGLVDELGGLDRAVAYCQRNYTESGEASVVVWPPKQSLWEYFMKQKDGGDGDLEDVELPSSLAFLFGKVLDRFASRELESRHPIPLVGDGVKFPWAMSGMMLTIDENSALRALLADNDVPDIWSNFPPSFWE